MATEQKTQINITLGAHYRDEVTGFEGIATGYCQFMHEDNQVQLENDARRDWFPVSRVVFAD